MIMIKLPRWVPKVPRPWNPAYRGTWDAMDDDAKRWSFLIDVGVCAAFCGILLLLRQMR